MKKKNWFVKIASFLGALIMFGGITTNKAQATKVITGPTLGYKFSGKVVKVEKAPGLRRNQILWWVMEVKDKEGKSIRVRIAPVWLYPSIQIKEGDSVEVEGFVPPFWRIKGFNEVMSCKIKDNNADILYDFTGTRKWCKRISFSTGSPSFNKKAVAGQKNLIKGKVIAVKKLPGPRGRRLWWVMDLEKDKEVYTIYLYPVRRLYNPGVREGDIVEAKVFLPLRWQRLNLKNTYLACFIKDVKTGKEHILRRCPNF